MAFRWFIPAIAGCVVAACDAPPLTSMMALSQVDFATTDARKLRVAVSVPETVQLIDDQVRLTVSLGVEDAPRVVRKFRLKAVGGSGKGLENAAPVVRVFALADAKSFDQFNAFRAQAHAADEAGEDSEGSLSVDPKLCRTTPEIPASVPVVLYLMTAELNRFVPLNRPKDIAAEARADGTTEAQFEQLLPRCS